ncbi:MAG TPA: T9SS type A sorting domain-containing protein, partial [Candidatus Cloacimonadota bacterium]|nr:T9SS type A sorting domain-containing protein [Candidatus Cloacimonadota bacterium]
RNGSWNSVAGNGSQIVMNISANKDLELPVVLGNEDPTLPVELSSFTATISAQNFVNLMWTTQSETGVSGYYIYRNIGTDVSQATLVSPLIPASNTSQTQNYIFTDTEITDAGTYYYWLQNVDFDGSNAYHGPVTLTYTTGGNNGTPVIPTVTELKSIYPNPFNPSAFISYGLATPSEVSISIYNNRGQMIRTIKNCPSTIGNHRIEWNGQDDNGKDCSSGVYIFRMNAGSQTFSQRAILVK